MKLSSEKFMDEMLKDNAASQDAGTDFAKILDERLEAAMKKYTENIEQLINSNKELEIIKEKENKEDEREEQGSFEGNDEGSDNSGSDS